MTSGETTKTTEWSRGEGLVMRSRGRAGLTRRALVGSLTLALASGCSRPGAGGDEAGDGTTGDTGTPADLDDETRPQ
jgi:hypothetical protein